MSHEDALRARTMMFNIILANAAVSTSLTTEHQHVWFSRTARAYEAVGLKYRGGYHVYECDICGCTRTEDSSD